MPLYIYNCSECHKEVKKILTPEQSKNEQKCKKCNSTLLRAESDVSMVVKEVIDNGLQPRKVEQIANAPDLLKEREWNSRKNKYKTKL